MTGTIRIAQPCGCTQETFMGQKREKRCEHGGIFEKPQSKGRGGSTLKPGKGFSASPEQRRKVRNRPCVVCGENSSFEIGEGTQANTIDAAHVYPRRLQSCACADGVVPICRRHHLLVDDPNRPFDLLPYLVTRGYHRELVHAVAEHGVPLSELLYQVTGERWAPIEADTQAPWESDDDPVATHRATQQSDGWWRAEYRLEPGGPWVALPQRFSTHIGRAETEAAAWAAREGALQTLEREAAV
jgi:hypothetical protein